MRSTGAPHMAHMGISARVWSIIAPHGPHMLAWDRRVECWCSTQGSGFDVWSSDAPHEACKGCAADCVERYCSTQRVWGTRNKSVESGLSTQQAYGDSGGSVEQYRSTQAANTAWNRRVEHCRSTHISRVLVWSAVAPHAPHERLPRMCGAMLLRT